jgi:hypothetical protein
MVASIWPIRIFDIATATTVIRLLYYFVPTKKTLHNAASVRYSNYNIAKDRSTNCIIHTVLFQKTGNKSLQNHKKKHTRLLYLPQQ